MNSVCPNGYICINHFNAFSIIIVILIILYVVNKENYAKLYSKITSIESNANSLDNVPDVQEYNHNHNHNHNQESIDIINSNNSHNVSNNRRLINDPLYPPLSRNPHIETKAIPINIETRESGGDFQQIGILSKDSVSDDSEKPGNNNDSVILPLYGKPTYKGSNNWLYYTESDRNNAIKIPLTINGKDCTDDIGCTELNDNDKVSISPYNGDFNVKIYKFNKPRYIPYI